MFLKATKFEQGSNNVALKWHNLVQMYPLTIRKINLISIEMAFSFILV